jgi:succinyl-CoA synthetase beta subunit
MKLPEYEGKELLESCGIPVPKRCGVLRIGDGTDTLRLDGPGPWVVKAQVPAGGRGKAGGVKTAKTPAEARGLAACMLGMKLATPQTRGAALTVEDVLVEEACRPEREIYISVTADRANACPAVIAAAEGGADIEELARAHPERIARVQADPDTGLLDFQARQLAFALKIPRPSMAAFTQLAQRLTELYIRNDATLAEVNPLAITESGGLMALDAKIIIDDSALFRHKELAGRPDREATETEREAQAIGISYIGLGGDIGCMVNGAGLAMATLDTVRLAGGDAANFLDVGGGADVDQVTKAFRILLKDPKVKAILVNIFGGIMKCDNIAAGVVQACRSVKPRVPLIVRLEGTRVQEGRAVLAASGLRLQQAGSLWEAARKAVAAARG